MSSLVDHVLNFSAPWAYVLVGALCFSESAFIVAFFIPGETALIFGGVIASEHHALVEVMVVVAIASTVLGYFAGFGFGRLFGPRLLESRLLRDRPAIERTRRTVADRGAIAVLIARFIPFVRAFMPGAAGASELGFRTFAVANLIGGAVWGSGYVIAGFLVGQAYRRFVHDAASVGVFLGAVAVVVLAVHFIHAHRSTRAERGES